MEDSTATNCPASARSALRKGSRSRISRIGCSMMLRLTDKRGTRNQMKDLLDVWQMVFGMNIECEYGGQKDLKCGTKKLHTYIKRLIAQRPLRIHPCFALHPSTTFQPEWTCADKTVYQGAKGLP